jgi:hypothetical protein
MAQGKPGAGPTLSNVKSYFLGAMFYGPFIELLRGRR